MARGRPPNPRRDQARADGEKFYAEAAPCPDCGTNQHYVINAACVVCARLRGSARYAMLDEAAKRQHAAKDHQRYLKRKTADAEPANDNVAQEIPDDAFSAS